MSEDGNIGEGGAAKAALSLLVYCGSCQCAMVVRDRSHMFRVTTWHRQGPQPKLDVLSLSLKQLYSPQPKSSPSQQVDRFNDQKNTFLNRCSDFLYWVSVPVAKPGIGSNR